MLPLRPPPPCPVVSAGDYRSYLRRAEWRRQEHGPLGAEQARADIEQAIELAPEAWEPWAVSAEVVWESDAVRQLQCYDEALWRGAGADIRLKRACLRDWMGRLLEAEADYSAVIESGHGHDGVIRRRALVRAQLGDLDGALEDTEPDEDDPPSTFLDDLHATLLWIKGDFTTAHRIFGASRVPEYPPEQRRVWSHLCQIAHGVQGPPPADPLDAAPAHGWSGVADTSDYSGLECGSDAGPEQPRIWLWKLLVALFLDRITPADVMEAARRPLRESDAWRPPAAVEGVSAIELKPPLLLWRSEVRFYCGMWHLSKRQMAAAREALAEAATGDCSRTLERLAAAAQLERLHRYGEQAALVPRLVLPGPAPHSVVARFVALEFKLPKLTVSARGATLDLTGQGLGDRGLAMLLASPNTLFVNRLDLSRNGITTAGMAAFRESANVVNLVELNLAGNRIGDAGLGMLLRSSALVSLVSLDLADAALTDEGAALLASQQHVGLKRIALGDMPVDLPVWRRLAERYGDGLSACGVFKQPYMPAFDPAKRVSFVHTHDPKASRMGWGAAQGGPSEHAVTSVIVFEAAAYVAWRLEGAAGARRGHRWGKSVKERLAAMHDLEAGFAAGQQRVHVVNSDEAFSLIRSGLTPLSLHCGACRKTYEPWSGGQELPFAHHCLCPAGHVLDAESARF